MKQLAFLTLLAVLLFGPVVATAQNVGYNPSSPGIGVPTTTWANKPDATAMMPGILYYCPDTPAGSSLIMSDGSVWRIFARGITTQSYTLLAADNGLHTFTLTNTTKPNVLYSIEDNTTTGLLTSNLQSVTATSAPVNPNRGADWRDHHRGDHHHHGSSG